MLMVANDGYRLIRALADLTRPAAQVLLDRFEPLAGATVIDAGRGALAELAPRVGAGGRVVALDGAQGIEEAFGAEIVAGRLTAPWPVGGARLVMMRYLLGRVPSPAGLLVHARAALAPAGGIAVQDLDLRGAFCDPPSLAFDRAVQLWIAARQAEGADPLVGDRLGRLLAEAGFARVDVSIAQPFGRTESVRGTLPLALAAVAPTATAAGIAGEDEIFALSAEIAALVARPEVTIGLPRVFQAWGWKA